MIRARWAMAFTTILLLFGICLSLFILNGSVASAKPDTVAISRIVKEIELNWPTVSNGEYSNYKYDFSILNNRERLIFQTNKEVSKTLAEGLYNQDVLMPISYDGQIVATAVIHTKQSEILLGEQKKLALSIAIAYFVFAAFAVWYFMRLHRTILRPFHEMQSFAKHVAAGNLEVPLQIKKDNCFGAFTEAFDIMRAQLKEAREKERQANQSKKELVASLSHDIKTPVTSIKLVTELLLATEKSEDTAKRLKTVSDKAEQIDLLITDLFQSTLEELGKLMVQITEESSNAITKLIQNEDYEDKVRPFKIPDCLIRADMQRLSQVVGNLISNSYKYAGTPIDVKAVISDGFLSITFQDYGPGAVVEDLPLLLNKYFRGRNVDCQQKAGAGLGLFIAADLMEKMGGGITCGNYADGFFAEIVIALI